MSVIQIQEMRYQLVVARLLHCRSSAMQHPLCASVGTAAKATAVWLLAARMTRYSMSLDAQALQQVRLLMALLSTRRRALDAECSLLLQLVCPLPTRVSCYQDLLRHLHLLCHVALLSHQ